MNKKYKLLKDLPDGSIVGDIYERIGSTSDKYHNVRITNYAKGIDEGIFLFTWQVENNSEWFQEIKEDERIEVKMSYLISRDADGFKYSIYTTKPIPEEKSTAIKSAIENVLNENGKYTSMKDAREWLLNAGRNTFNDKKYTEKDLEDLYNRWGMAVRNIITISGKTLYTNEYQSFQDYLKSIQKP